MNIERMRKIREIRRCATALYLLGGIQEMYVYLEGYVDSYGITEEYVDDLMDKIIKSYENTTMAEIDNLKLMEV